MMTVGVLLSVAVGAARAGERRISYQGVLVNKPATASVQVRLRKADGSQVWGPEVHSVTPDGDGRFVLLLGSQVDLDGPLSQLSNSEIHSLELEVAVSENGGSFVPVSPRQRLLPAFYATEAAAARLVEDGGVATEGALADEVVTRRKLSGDVQTALVPVGSVTAFAGDAPPPESGWLVCDGSVHKKADYPELAAVLGTRYYLESDLAADSFRLPDYRGYFLRGTDCVDPAGQCAGRDPDASSRTAAPDYGGASGKEIGSVQTGLVGAHRHYFKGYTAGTGGGSRFAAATDYNVDIFNHDADAPEKTSGIGSETRPLNISVLWLIKY